MEEVAIFPIPNCVTFPGQVVSLHVFEPRYRTMVQDCLAEERPLAVCGVKRLLEKTDKKLTTENIFSTNLSLFEPVPVVTYGDTELIEQLADGRFLIEVSMRERARIKTFLELEPYYIAKVDPIYDEEIEPSAHQSVLRAEMASKFETLWNSARKDEAPLPFDVDALTFGQLSFHILGFLQTDPVLAQLLLEETNPEKRASILLDILSSMEMRIAS